MSWFGKPNALDKSTGTPAQVAAWNAALGALSGLSGPIREQDLIGVGDALQQACGLTMPEASAVASWLGGYANKTGFWGTISDAFQLGDPDVYMDVENLTDGQNGVPLVIGDVLRKLRDNQPAAHAWVIDRATAKRDKKQIDSDADLEQHRLKVINAEIDMGAAGVKAAATLANDAATGVEGLFGGLGAMLKNPMITIGIALAVAVGLVVLYLVFQSRITRLIS